MKETKNIDSNLLIKSTGDPFADTGGLVIKFLTELHLKKQVSELNEKDILGLIEFAAKIYVNSWGGKLHSFFHGSKITNPSIKGNGRKVSGTIELYKNIIENKETNEKGFCRITGRYTELFSSGNSLYILVGSGGFVNFHHGFQEGILVSKEILIRLFFVPFGVEYLGDKIALLLSNSQMVNEYLVKSKIVRHIRMLANGLSNGVIKSDFYNPINALFDYADKCIQNLSIATYDMYTEKSNTEGITLNLYHFTNFITSPEVKLYELPATVFAFYAYCIKYHKKDWIAFTTANYRKFENYERATYNEELEIYSENATESILIPKKKVEELKAFEQLNFKLSIAGEKLMQENQKKGEDKTATDYFVFNKTEFEYWKQSKSYKDWKKEYKDFNIESKVLKETVVLTYKKDDFKKKWANLIYNKLLSERSIINNILEWNEKHSFNFSITTTYQLNIISMNSETIKQIDVISEFIISDINNIRKSIRSIKTNKYGELRSFLIRQIEKNYKSGNSKLISLQDYVKYLFPENRNWLEIRDLLLICIYQKLHDNNINIYTDDDEDDESNEDKDDTIPEPQLNENL